MPFEEYDTQVDEETGDSLGTDIVDDSGLAGESQEAEGAQEATPQIDPTAELRAELESMKASLGEAHKMLKDAYPAFQQQQAAQREAASKPPFEWHQIQDTNQLKQYLDWQLSQRETQLVAQMQQTAAQTQSEATVRGVLSREAVGSGWAYDDLIQKFAGPAVRQDPKLAEFFYSQPDPAMNMYMFSLFHGLLDHFKGDTVKMVKSVVGAVTKPGQVGKDVVTRINQAANRGAMRVLKGSNQGPDAASKVDNHFKMSTKEFRALMAQNG